MPRCIVFALLTTLLHATPAWHGPQHFENTTDTDFTARGPTHSVSFTPTAITMHFPHGQPLRMEFPTAARPIGSHPSGSHFTRLHYPSLFPGIHLDVYWKDGELEYDWIVTPGADPTRIRFSFRGATRQHLTPQGDLALDTPHGRAFHRNLDIYQPGKNEPIQGGFRLHPDGTVGFHIAAYDTTRPLIIDPQLIWAAGFGGRISYDGGTLHPRIDDSASSIAVDPAGNVYITGTSIANTIPLVKPIQNQCDSNHCVYLTKLSPDGATVLYSTYLGHPGFSFNFPLYDGKAPIPASVAVDAEGNAYVAGAAASFPKPDGAQLQSAGGFDGFVAKISPTGALLAAILIGGGGDDQATAITLGPDGFLYITGTSLSANFPVTPGAYRTPLAGAVRFFAARLNPKQLDVQYASDFGVYSRSATSLSGYRYPQPRIAADAGGNAYVSVFSDCSGLEASPGALRATCSQATGKAVATVAKLNPTGSQLLWTAMPAGSGDSLITGVAVAPDRSVYLAGTTESEDFPYTAEAFQTQQGAFLKAAGFVGRLKPDGSGFLYATSVGGRGLFYGLNGLALDASGTAYIAGAADNYHPTLRSMASNCCGSGGGFVTAVNPDGRTLAWSTLLGRGRVDALTLDAAGNVFAVGPDLNPSATFANTPIGGPSSRIDVVKLTPAGDPIPIEAIVNAASYQPGLPKAGGLASLFARGLPANEDGTGLSILVNGVPAPILSVTHSGGQQQVNLQVPYQSLPVASNRLELRFKGVSTYAFPVITPPGIFTLPDGAGAIQHASDFSLVTPHNPAAPGETIIVYATGLGPVTPSASTGVPPSGPATVTGYCRVPPSLNIGRVLYAGVTPGISGVYQLNVQLPDAMTAGDTPIHIQFTECPATTPPRPVFPVITRSNSVSLPVR